jgi:basic amino acid/polyamine antiporter, APA family
MGLTKFQEGATSTPLADLLASVPCDVVVIRANPGWKLSQVQEILVPVGGLGWHDILRARMLGSLFRKGDRQVTFLRVLPTSAPELACKRARRALARIARDEAPGYSGVKIVQHDDPERVITEHAAESDLVILGVQRLGPRRKAFGHICLKIARETTCPILMISHRG